jgi:predicted GTPase
VLVISKSGSARPEDIAAIRARAQELNPQAQLCLGDLDIRVDERIPMKNRKVLVVEDGPTVTHGGMP